MSRTSPIDRCVSLVWMELHETQKFLLEPLAHSELSLNWFALMIDVAWSCFDQPVLAPSVPAID